MCASIFVQLAVAQVGSSTSIQYKLGQLFAFNAAFILFPFLKSRLVNGFPGTCIWYTELRFIKSNVRLILNF